MQIVDTTVVEEDSKAATATVVVNYEYCPTGSGAEDIDCREYGSEHKCVVCLQVQAVGLVTLGVRAMG